MERLKRGIFIAGIAALTAAPVSAAGGGENKPGAEKTGPPTFHSLPETRTPVTAPPLNRTGTAIMKQEVLAEEGKLEAQQKARKRELILEKYREMVGPEKASRLFGPPEPERPPHSERTNERGTTKSNETDRKIDTRERRRQVKRQVEAAFGSAGAKEVRVRDDGDDKAIVEVNLPRLKSGASGPHGRQRLP